MRNRQPSIADKARSFLEDCQLTTYPKAATIKGTYKGHNVVITVDRKGEVSVYASRISYFNEVQYQHPNQSLTQEVAELIS